VHVKDTSGHIKVSLHRFNCDERIRHCYEYITFVFYVNILSLTDQFTVYFNVYRTAITLSMIYFIITSVTLYATAYIYVKP